VVTAGLTLKIHQTFSTCFGTPPKTFPSNTLCSTECLSGTNLLKKNLEKKSIKEGGWGEIPLSYSKIKYVALDTRIGFELARKK
jgi:hypothetical protein